MEIIEFPGFSFFILAVFKRKMKTQTYTSSSSSSSSDEWYEDWSLGCNKMTFCESVYTVRKLIVIRLLGMMQERMWRAERDAFAQIAARKIRLTHLHFSPLLQCLQAVYNLVEIRSGVEGESRFCRSMSSHIRPGIILDKSESYVKTYLCSLKEIW